MFDKYFFVGHFYEMASRLYSGNAIPRCREAMLDHLKPGDKVVFGGVGYGWDAIKAAQLGADVTIVEISPTMIAKFNATVKKAGAEHLKLRAVQSDILEFNEFESYDMVVANFFLNVHTRELMMRIWKQMIKLGKPGSKFVIGDFELPSGNFLTRMVKHIYYLMANVTFYFIAGNALHIIYDYPTIMKTLGLELKEVRYIPFLGINFYWALLAEKKA